MDLYRKRRRKDTLYMSKRHLRRLVAQEAEFISKRLVHKSSPSDIKCTTNVDQDKLQYERINFDDTENENNIVQYEDIQSASESDSQSCENVSYNESSEDFMDVDNENERELSFENNLATWAVEYQIPHNALNALLCRLKKHSCFSTLSADARTLLKTPRKQHIRTVVPGTYYHFGLLKPIKQILSSVKENIDCLKIAINIDGLPLYKVIAATVLAYTWLHYS